MDWIDPRFSTSAKPPAHGRGIGSKKSKQPSQQSARSEKKAAKQDAKPAKLKPNKPGKPLANQVVAALAQPLDVWTAAFDHALAGLPWPSGCTPEGSFLFSAVMQEQAEVLVRAGLSAKKLSAMIADDPNESDLNADDLRVHDLQAKGQAPVEQRSAMMGLMNKSLESTAFEWLDACDAYPYAALGVAAVAWNIPDQARRPVSGWLTQWLQAAMDRTAVATLDPEESVLCGLVIQCELPLLIGVATAASKRTALGEASRAMDRLAELLEVGEEDPTPWLVHGGTYLRASLASVLRCRVLADALGLRKWFPPQQKALAELLKHAARWSRPDGTPLLGAGKAAPRATSIWEALIKQTNGQRSMVQVMALNGLAPLAKLGQPRKELKLTRLPPATHYSENAAAAIMQSDWRHKGSRIAVDFSDTEVFIEALGPKGASILSGEWNCQVACNGQAEFKLEHWGAACWFSDDDVDYLELEGQFGQHAKVQRQIILFREPRLLFLADALLCDIAGDWSLTSKFPLNTGVEFETNVKTTEGYLVANKSVRCLTLPISLPEWRRQPSPGGLSRLGDQLLMQQACKSSTRLYAPVLISLCNRHAKKTFTWRRLTVGEDLRIVRQDEAVAYRVQIGKDQFVFYRTLAPAKRRTALGMHTLADFYAAKFDAQDGDVDTLVEVEPSTSPE